ncbi:DUF1062 domain-containing protein [Parablautia muri]|uniref:DUF1062 domain-containing protein n=1 Tax=Parablautia muri TaxID=2320879 RepID=A0A9X5BHI2_9FIRM|nr:DUF1062 domain-containing protein [Parablautia muri]NBJ93794.1 DUF1062 domain-containing protein [Parablautia muri]
MKKVAWEIQSLSLLPVLKYCKKCGKKNVFVCSEQFRINAQRKSLDVWLIYKCSSCNTTWNADVYSRVVPQAIPQALLDGFCKNDKELVKQYAMDSSFLQNHGVEAGLPKYSILGERFSFSEDTEVEIKNQYSLPIRISSAVREKLHLSQREYLQLVSEGQIESVPGQNLKKAKLKARTVLILKGKKGKFL